MSSQDLPVRQIEHVTVMVLTILIIQMIVTLTVISVETCSVSVSAALVLLKLTTGELEGKQWLWPLSLLVL